MLGVPLMPGERVLFVEKPSYLMEKIIYWVIGALTLIVLIGIIFIVMAIFWDKWNPRGNVVTNQRFIHVKGSGEAISVALQDIADLDIERRRASSGGGGLLGAAISAGVNAIANSMANQNHKADPKFWSRGVAVIVVRRNMQRIKCKTSMAPQLGPFVIRMMMNPAGIEQLPTAQIPA